MHTRRRSMFRALRPLSDRKRRSCAMIEKLEDRRERATACHVLIKGPDVQQAGRRCETSLLLVFSQRRTAGKARTRAAPPVSAEG